MSRASSLQFRSISSLIIAIGLFAIALVRALVSRHFDEGAFFLILAHMMACDGKEALNELRALAPGTTSQEPAPDAPRAGGEP